jgi:uncharacterized protein (DUF1330 family)
MGIFSDRIFSTSLKANTMAKAYLISIYIEIHHPEKLKAYAVDALPAMQANGARFLARSTNIEGMEGQIPQRAVELEFESMEAAKAAYKSGGSKPALGKPEAGVDDTIFWEGGCRGTSVKKKKFFEGKNTI